MKVMLACSKQPQLDQLKYPVLVSNKLDGIRSYTVDSKPYSRTNKLIPNRFVQTVIGAYGLHGTDGELIITNGSFNGVQSAIMCGAGTPNFEYHLFDKWDCGDKPYTERLKELDDYIHNRSVFLGRVHILNQTLCEDKEQLFQLYTQAINSGYEGLIVRSLYSKYKQGRSTLNEGYMLKLKPEDDAEATVIGFKELLRNTDTSTRRLENMVCSDALGSLTVVSEQGVEFDIGSGFNDLQRIDYWASRKSLLGKKVTYKYQELFPTGKPRFPVFKGFRND